MTVQEIGAIAKIVLGRFKKYWTNPKVKKIAVEIRDGINELILADEEAA